MDNGFCLITENPSLYSPVAVLHYEVYHNLKDVLDTIENENEKIQCVVCSESLLKSSVYFGQTQNPDIKEYADNVDTIEFLLSLNE